MTNHSRVLACSILRTLVLSVCPSVGVFASLYQSPDGRVARVQEMIRVGNGSEVIEMMAAQGDPSDVAELYISVIRDLYRANDLRAAVLVAQHGIDYCLSESIGGDPLADALRGSAKALAFNLGSYTWPGWDEPGIQITPENMSIGYGAALLNLRLGEALGRGPEPMSSAHWLIGAHELASGQYRDAIESFRNAANLARTANSRPMELLALGFAGITKVAGGLAIDEGAAELADVRAELGSVTNPESWINQLDTAYDVFVLR